MFVEKLPGKGNLNFVLIHNAGGDHRFFTHQIPMLRQFGDVIQLDLPGSGQSSPISSYKMSDLSSLIAAICNKLSLQNICLVGLNNGAIHLVIQDVEFWQEGSPYFSSGANRHYSSNKR